MKSMVSSLVFVFIAFFLSFVAAAPVVARDVFVPPVLIPNDDTVWEIGTKQIVTWDASHPPKLITNHEGRIILVKNDRLDLDNPLAVGLDILAGSAEVVVPDVEVGDNYQIIVFGNSGNTSGRFSIVQRIT